MLDLGSHAHRHGAATFVALILLVGCGESAGVDSGDETEPVVVEGCDLQAATADRYGGNHRCDFEKAPCGTCVVDRDAPTTTAENWFDEDEIDNNGVCRWTLRETIEDVPREDRVLIEVDFAERECAFE